MGEGGRRGPSGRAGVTMAGVVLLAVAACAELLAPGDTSLVAHWQAGDLVLENRGTRTVYYFPVEAERAALILWGQCVGSGCPHLRVEGGEVARMSADRISGWTEESSELLVYWWVAHRTAHGGREPGPLEFIRVAGGPTK